MKKLIFLFVLLSVASITVTADAELTVEKTSRGYDIKEKVADLPKSPVSLSNEEVLAAYQAKPLTTTETKLRLKQVFPFPIVKEVHKAKEIRWDKRWIVNNLPERENNPRGMNLVTCLFDILLCIYIFVLGFIYRTNNELRQEESRKMAYVLYACGIFASFVIALFGFPLLSCAGFLPGTTIPIFFMFITLIFLFFAWKWKWMAEYSLLNPGFILIMLVFGIAGNEIKDSIIVLHSLIFLTNISE